MRYYYIAVTVFFCVSTLGCGTMANLDGKRLAFLSAPGQKPVRVYGGVRNDFDWVADGVGFPGSPQLEGKRKLATITEDPMGVVLGVPLCGYFAIVDPVLSFVGDTVTLPHVMRVIYDDRQRKTAVAQPPTVQHDASEQNTEPELPITGF